MVNMFGAQRVTLAGSLVTFIGFVMSAFPPSLYYMYASHGVITGKTSLCYMYVPLLHVRVN